ncbi:uncharacterized protein LOC114950049 [Acropora millepora]|uniref:uncharacterized protein LOC114950049 n=1 Tax=Acropora millepora TaxID=45264 RepID=UPI001CF4DE51|nr:uncharacterized protein LOC114950049 [Acropora millepora]
MPTVVKSVPYEELCSIDFTSAKAKKRKLNDKISDISAQSAELARGCQAFPKNPSYVPSQDQIKTFYESLHGTGIKPAINALVPPYNQEYLPKVETLDLPQHLPDLYDENLIEQTYDDLVRKSRDIFTSMSCTSKQVKIAEEFTRSQSKSNLWFRLRSGKITASKFYDACKTKPTSPSISLVKEICYGTKKFHSKATDWGCKHEKTALQQYAKIMKENHADFHVKESGLMINPLHPHLGASPDAISF